MANTREKRDHERLRQALEKSTSTPHTLVDWKKGKENQETQVLARGRVPVPVGRKQNDSNNTRLAKAAKTNRTAKADLRAQGIGANTKRAFGVPPILTPELL
jgi:hypothetical protein